MRFFVLNENEMKKIHAISLKTKKKLYNSTSEKCSCGTGNAIYT